MTLANETTLDPTPTMETAHDAFNAFLNNAQVTTCIAGLHDSDADGVTAGVVWQRGLERLGHAPLRLIPNRERNAWTPTNRASLLELNPEMLFVMDLGSQETPVLNGVPTCFIDHHHPEGCPPGDTLISAYTWNPIPNTSILVYDLLLPRVDVSDLDWVAAIGALSDLGDKAPFELVEQAKKKYTAKYLREVTSLVNASRRASEYNPEAAARALLNHDSPRALFDSDSPDVEFLRKAREEVKAAMEEARKAAPVFAGQVALVRLNTPCQVHPLIAQSWRTRLPKYMVIVANEGYMPGRINFSARSMSDKNVLEFLRSFDLGEGEGHFGHGHDQASGGSLPADRWNLLLEKMGFPATVRAGN